MRSFIILRGYIRWSVRRPVGPSIGPSIALWDKTRSFWDIKNSFSHEQGSEQNERASKRVSAAESASKASSPEQPRIIQTQLLCHSLVRSVVRLHRSLVCLLHSPHSAALTRLLARSLRSLPSSWDNEWLDGYLCCVFSILALLPFQQHLANPALIDWWQ